MHACSMRGMFRASLCKVSTRRRNSRKKPGLREGCMPYVLLPNVLYPNHSQVAIVPLMLVLHTTIFVDCVHTLSTNTPEATTLYRGGHCGRSLMPALPKCQR
jgi:hypothetical protein